MQRNNNTDNDKRKDCSIMKKYFFAIIGIVIVYAIISTQYTAVLSRYGSRGSEVKNIQVRLKDWGYYTGKNDGIYGPKTEKAVRWFQKNNNLKVDGIAGEKTLSKIGLPTGKDPSKNSNSSYNANVELLARVINGESRGEPYEGQVAVGAVILNRVKHPSFPNSIAGVIYQERAFTAVSDGQIHSQMYESSYRAARDALNGWDPSGGAIYYYNPATATSSWIYSRPLIKTIGQHKFCK